MKTALDVVLDVLEIVEKLRALIKERGISDQTLLLVLVIVIAASLLTAFIVTVLRIIRQEKRARRRVADERDEFEVHIFINRKSQRLSSRDFEIDDLTLWQFIKRVWRHWRGKKE